MRVRVVQLLEEGAGGIPSVGDLRRAQTVAEGGEGGVGRVATDGVVVGRHVGGAGITGSRRPRVGGGGGHDVGWENDEEGRDEGRSVSPILASRATFNWRYVPYTEVLVLFYLISFRQTRKEEELIMQI